MARRRKKGKKKNDVKVEYKKSAKKKVLEKPTAIGMALRAAGILGGKIGIGNQSKAASHQQSKTTSQKNIKSPIVTRTEIVQQESGKVDVKKTSVKSKSSIQSDIKK